MDNIKLYNIKELSDFLNITPQTVRKYINDGKIKGIKIGGRWMVTEQALKEFLKID